MNKTIRKLILIVLVFLGFALFIIRSTPPNPVALIRVVDTAGKPIAGATIRPDGLRPKRINGHWRWDENKAVKPSPVVTDAQGIARVPYPRYVFEKAETGEISFYVEHPDFCSDRPFRVVSATPPANAKLKDQAEFLYRLVMRRIVTKPEPVILKRGGIIKVTGYLGAKENLVPTIHAQLASMALPRNGFWQSVDSVALMNRRIPEGTNAVRLVYFPITGRTCFSDDATFLSVEGQTNELCLELKPGSQLSGRLDDSVPRPVTNGRVQISINSADVNTNGNHFLWQVAKVINADGTFLFESLPPGKVEIIALCDGFKSKDGAAPKISNFIMPQVFQLEHRDLAAVIAMEPTANFEVTVLDEKQQPMADASVYFAPNVIWNGRGSTIFMKPTFDSENLLRSDEDFNWSKFWSSHPSCYQAHTDKRGIAIVPNLPAFKQWFGIDHANHELPINPINNERELSAQLIPGETCRTTVTLQKKGAQFLQSPR
jgi:hypothetical protein